MALYRTKQGDRLDTICQQHYGQTTDLVEAVLTANPGLGLKLEVFEAGELIQLPELSIHENPSSQIRLWS